jgi:predicted acetyltransferase
VPSTTAPISLVTPSLEYIASYRSAQLRGWDWDDEAREHDDDRELIAALTKQEPGTFITLADGSQVPRIPGFKKWIWDGEFSGSIGLRWQPGTTALPPHCLGHIGYAVVPWKQKRGYATQALRLIIEEARILHMEYVELTTDKDNLASIKVIESNGGRFVEEFIKPPSSGSKSGCRFRIYFSDLPMSHATN